MSKLYKFKSVITVFIILLASAAYAMVAKDITQASELTWALWFNSIVPPAIIAWVGKRYVDGQDKVNKELIDCKNNHESRIGVVETTQKIRGCDHLGDAPHPRNRRRGDFP